MHPARRAVRGSRGNQHGRATPRSGRHVHIGATPLWRPSGSIMTSRTGGPFIGRTVVRSQRAVLSANATHSIATVQ